jgi:FkbM family methyltransferase
MSQVKKFLRSAKHFIATTFHLSWLYGKTSYSQDGEDLFIAKFFDRKHGGFYVDIGAHHPYRYSNTYLLSQRGWTGINIDATPGSMASFKRLRPQDINLELAVTENTGNFTYYIFEDSALNTLSEERASEVLHVKQSELQEKVTIEALPLTEVLQKYLPKNQPLNFMNIDVEGADEAILRSNDWRRFRPELLAIEILSQGSIEEITHLPICTFLKKQSYQLIARFSNTAFFSPVKD